MTNVATRATHSRVKGVICCWLASLVAVAIAGPAVRSVSLRTRRFPAAARIEQRVGLYAANTAGVVLTSGLSTIPAGIILRLPPRAQVITTTPMRDIPRLFVAPPYKAWRWPTRLRSGVAQLAWQQRILNPTGSFKLLGGGSHLSGSLSLQGTVGGTATLKLRAAVAVVASRKMDQLLEGPRRARVAANCGSPARASNVAFEVRQMRLPKLGAVALTLSAHGGRGCYYVQFPGTGTYLIQMRARSLRGAGPAFCVWEARFGPCILSWFGGRSKGWEVVRDFIAIPHDSYLYLYASASQGATSEVQFANVQIWRIELPPRAAYIEEPRALG